MGKREGVVPRLLYGLLFTAGVPLLLVLWARATGDAVRLPELREPRIGALLATAGLALMAAGWLALLRHGGGLPMNAFPPPRLVTTGIYRWLADPIYIGFGAIAFGLALATGSASGLWLVAPITCLAMATLVGGFERSDLRRRFRTVSLPRPRISLPRGGEGEPDGWERLSVFLLVFGPWLVAYYGVQFLGAPPDAFHVELPFERRLPVLQWTEAIYASTYLFVTVTPLLIGTRAGLRRFALAGLVATVVATLLWISIPVVVDYRGFEPTNLLGRLLLFEMQTSSAVAAFPAFHVLWAFIAADAWARLGRTPISRPIFAFAGWGLAILIALSCITTSMHALLDVVAAVLLFVPLRDPDSTWERLRDTAERIANSWREWRVGPVRILSHGLFAALAATLGFALAAMAAGPHAFPEMVLLGLCALAGAGLWAQALEGSPKLLRPFGYYGGMLGFLVGAGVLALGGADVIPLLAAWTVAGPWVQAIGRLRCLVQGCCHGAPAAARIGIRYFHNRSRVTQIAGLTGVPLHPTPLYSILGNGVSGLVLLRLWTAGAPPSLVLGLYLIGNGLARFVEESRRGEPQTPILGGLHVYHWFALLGVLLGIGATMLGSTPPDVPFAGFDARLALTSAGFGLLAGFAMGVDFPASNRRFSRLASADSAPALLPVGPDRARPATASPSLPAERKLQPTTG
jgi:protein-S-isoprenylcysteine O-methyltransferase Ste14